MNERRILLVEADERRLVQLEDCLRSAEHSILSVKDLTEAAEALLLQKLEVVLIGSGQQTEAIRSFVTKLRTKEAHETGSPVAIISCSAAINGASELDGSLPESFDAEQFSRVLREISKTPVFTARDGAPVPGNLPVFEPERFEEQCANEAELMVEIIDLFAEECTGEIPEMAEVLESGDFERLSRLAHTLKGSLGSLHAPTAWQQAQQLESAAQARDKAMCATAFSALERSLAELDGHLKRFRKVCLAR